MSHHYPKDDIVNPISRSRALKQEPREQNGQTEGSGTGSEPKKTDGNQSRDALLILRRDGTVNSIVPGFLEPLLTQQGPDIKALVGRPLQELSFFNSITRQLVDRQMLQGAGPLTPGTSKLQTTLLGTGFAGSLPVDTRLVILPTEDENLSITLIFQPAEIREIVEEDLRFLTYEYEKMMKHYQEAEEEFEVLKEMKTNFMSLTSHELLTPLQIMMGNLDLLRSKVYGELSQKQTDKLEVIIRNTARIYDITRSMYDLSRTKTRFFSLNKEPTDLVPLLKEIASDFSVLLDNQKIEFRLDLPDQLPQIPLDRRSFWQVWSEIFDFFAHYSTSGDSLVLSVRETRDNLELVLHREGAGLSRKHRQFIFESFYEPINILNHKEGSGLQLTLAKRYVDAHGGDMWVDGEENEGLTFHILLPKKIPLEKTLEWKMLKAEKMAGFFSDTI